MSDEPRREAGCPAREFCQVSRFQGTSTRDRMALNRGFTYRSQILPRDAGHTLLEHLAATYQHSDVAAWTDRIARREVTLDGRPAGGDERLRPGQICDWHRPPWNEPEVPLTFDVLLDAGALLAVNKPSGLPTLPAGGFLDHTLWTLVRRQYPGASPVHRLGRFTSGLVLFARTRQAGAALSQAWREHRVEKHYRALGTGRPSWTMREIAAPIGLAPHPRLGTVHAASSCGKPARTAACAVGARGDDTLFDVRISTGRPHQIRIHLAFAGHPLVGDALYAAGGRPRIDSPALPGDGGYLLHAHRVTVAHPVSGETIHLEAPVPPGLA